MAGTNIFVVGNLHENIFTERSLGVRHIVKRFTKLLYGYHFVEEGVECGTKRVVGWRGKYRVGGRLVSHDNVFIYQVTCFKINVNRLILYYLHITSYIFINMYYIFTIYILFI